jgi:hypothetical protein
VKAIHIYILLTNNMSVLTIYSISPGLFRRLLQLILRINIYFSMHFRIYALVSQVAFSFKEFSCTFFCQFLISFANYKSRPSYLSLCDHPNNYSFCEEYKVKFEDDCLLGSCTV